MASWYAIPVGSRWQYFQPFPSSPHCGRDSGCTIRLYVDDFDIRSAVISSLDWNNERMGQEPFGGVVPGDVWFDYKRLFCTVTSVESEKRRYVLLLSPLDFLCSRLRDSKNVFILSSRAIDPLGFNSREKCTRLHHSNLLFTSTSFWTQGNKLKITVCIVWPRIQPECTCVVFWFPRVHAWKSRR